MEVKQPRLKRKASRIVLSQSKSKKRRARQSQVSYAIAKMVLGQKKVFQITYAPQALAANWTAQSLCLIAEGDTNATRTGRRIIAQAIALKFYFLRNGADAIIRYIIVQDSQQIADTAPGITSVLAADNFFSMLQADQIGRFKVLIDQTLRVTAAEPFAWDRRYLRLGKGTELKYNGAATTDIAKNGLYLYFVTSVGANFPDLYGNIRMYFIDA